MIDRPRTIDVNAVMNLLRDNVARLSFPALFHVFTKLESICFAVAAASISSAFRLRDVEDEVTGVGLPTTVAVGVNVGPGVGTRVGLTVGRVGLNVGAAVGRGVGEHEGVSVGAAVVGETVGIGVGLSA